MKLEDLQKYVEQAEEGLTVSLSVPVTHIGKLVEIAWEAHSLADEIIEESLLLGEAQDKSERILERIAELEAI